LVEVTVVQRLGRSERERRTSKLLRTIVGVGIALGAAPACFGRTEVASDASPFGPKDDDTTFNPSGRGLDGGPSDANSPDPVDPPIVDASHEEAAPDGAPIVDAAADAADAGADAADAGDAAADPFCDVAWPPTKGGPFPPNAPCFDPLHECDDAWVPRGCHELFAPGVCSYERSWEGPLFCIDGEWRCPTGSEDGPRCECFGPLPPGETCATDAGG
jgi:hypothetical protein